MAGAVQLGTQPCTSFQCFQSSSCPIELECCRWRSTQRVSNWVSTPVLTSKVEFGKPLLKVTRNIPFTPAALPLDRSTLKDAGQSSPHGGEDSEPWIGAIIFKRSGFQTHYEFQTSLERLGMGFLSTESSRESAKAMGLISLSKGPAMEEVTPVNISIDVMREGESKNLRLDGVARTTISLCCNRCLSPVVERIFADFSLLLTENPVDEPTQTRIGVVLGSSGGNDEFSQLDIDLDDKLYFPREAKEMDLSKYLRDTVHLEIPSKSLCSLSCLGLCLTCGVNLNMEACECGDAGIETHYGPLEDLRKRLEEEERREKGSQE